MKHRASPTLIGAFVVGGLLLVLAGVIAAAGGALFTRTELVVMHFNGSIYGLQVGAPVVFRGVNIGHVTSIGVVYDQETGEFSIPVVAEVERDAIRAGSGNGAQRASITVPALVAKGLRAQLSMQSLLTGQLYVDLDLRPERPASMRGAFAGAVEIPTSPTAIQNLKAQLDGMDFRRLLDDVSAIATSAQRVLAGPELQQALKDVAAVSANVRRLTEQLERSSAPLVKDTRDTLAEARRAVGQLGRAADGVGDTARRLGDTADRFGALAAADSPLVTSVQRTADELAQTAASLRRHTGDDAVLVRRMDDALQDLSRASRAVRTLAETLDRQPDALLRGRSEEPADAQPPR